MQRAGYPDLASHTKLPGAFIQKAGELKDRFDRGEKHLTIETMNFLKNWLVNHIQGQDKHYAPFVTACAANWCATSLKVARNGPEPRPSGSVRLRLNMVRFLTVAAPMSPRIPESVH